MGFDLSAVDAELEQLSGPLSAQAPEGAFRPENTLHLARSFAGGSGSETQTLADVDDELSALAQVSGVAEPLYVTRPQRAPIFSRHDAMPAHAPEGALRLSTERPVAGSSGPIGSTSSAPAARKRSSIPLPPAGTAEQVSVSAHAPESALQHFASEPPAALHSDDDDAEQDAAIASLGAEEGPPASAWPISAPAPEGALRPAMSGEPSFALPPESIRPQSIAPAAARESTPLTQSQEIVLPDPIPREELSTESGELSLDSPLTTNSPGSGSYSLPDAQPHREEAQNFGRSGSHNFSDLVDDDVQDALEGSQPLSIGAPSALTRATRTMDRDPDAEFDALLSEATDPRGMPVVSGELDTDDLLRGLELDEIEIDDTPVTEESEADQVTHEADALARSLYEEPEADNTEILDRASALAIEAQAPRKGSGASAAEGDTFREEFAPDGELDSGELEIMLDDEPSPAPATSKAPPPPPPGSADKRPSILGRLFGGKRDGE